MRCTARRKTYATRVGGYCYEKGRKGKGERQKDRGLRYTINQAGRNSGDGNRFTRGNGRIDSSRESWTCEDNRRMRVRKSRDERERAEAGLVRVCRHVNEKADSCQEESRTTGRRRATPGA